MRTARAELTDRILITGPRHPRAVLDEYVAHCNQHRPHQARNLRPPDSDDIITAPITDLTTARIRRHKVLGGLIHEYEQGSMTDLGSAVTLQLRDHEEVMEPYRIAGKTHTKTRCLFLGGCDIVSPAFVIRRLMRDALPTVMCDMWPRKLR